MSHRAFQDTLCRKLYRFEKWISEMLPKLGRDPWPLALQATSALATRRPWGDIISEIWSLYLSDDYIYQLQRLRLNATRRPVGCCSGWSRWTRWHIGVYCNNSLFSLLVYACSAISVSVMSKRRHSTVKLQARDTKKLIHENTCTMELDALAWRVFVCHVWLQVMPNCMHHWQQSTISLFSCIIINSYETFKRPNYSYHFFLQIAWLLELAFVNIKTIKVTKYFLT